MKERPRQAVAFVSAEATNQKGRFFIGYRLLDTLEMYLVPRDDVFGRAGVRQGPKLYKVFD